MSKNKFEQGDVVKSNLRSPESCLFLLVLHDPNPSSDQFNAVILYDSGHDFWETEDSKTGYVSNIWNTDFFDISNFSEMVEQIKNE